MTCRPGAGRRIARATLALLLGLAAGPLQAAGGAPPMPGDGRRSGFHDMGASTQALQRDDDQNPAWLWVAQGEALWQQPAGSAARSCASCHGDARASMRGVAARHPAVGGDGRITDLAGRINACRTQRQRAPAWAPGSDELLAMTMWVSLPSRGLPVAPPDDPVLAAARERGRAWWTTRLGALNLSCAQCHDERAGQRLGGALIPQGHATGYPIYRLEWQGPGNLQRRLRSCLAGVRAEPWPADDPAWLDLEAWLMARARGMALETPGVRP